MKPARGAHTHIVRQKGQDPEELASKGWEKRLSSDDLYLDAAVLADDVEDAVATQSFKVF
ncbi:MAG: hypothetical protein GXP47_13165 [Acidobacteria bacterium]|nr:hypothetical protein [Acidobacteriota bacterium]